MGIVQAVISPSRFEVRFDSLFTAGRGMVFPCDEAGRVDLDALSDRGRNSYFYARAMMGRQYAAPRVVPARSTGA
jgi:hypothetical protein